MGTTWQRDYWDGHPVELGDAWTLHKDDKGARCVLLSHLFGHELKLLIDGELFRSKVCKSSDEVLDTQEPWKAAMLKKGWR